MWRNIFVPYLSFYLPGFHPWRHDDRALITTIERQLAADSPV
jgi:predicted metal-dependent hydrolase